MSSQGRRVNKQVAHFTLIRQRRGAKTLVRCDQCTGNKSTWTHQIVAFLGKNEDWDCGHMLDFLRAHAHGIEATPMELFRELFSYDRRRCRRAARLWRERLQIAMLKAAGVTDG